MSKANEQLNQVLADTYLLGVKTHAAHWNVTGPYFNALHIAFSTQYTALLEGADVLAERLRALGHKAPTGMKSLLKHASLDAEISVSDGVKLAKSLAEDHRALAKSCAKAIAVAEDADDRATVDLLTVRTIEHEKTAWMLESTAA